jgi:hypothetical protein
VFVISWALGAVVAALTKGTVFQPAESESEDQADEGHAVHGDKLDEV